jgi:hypothetical protein
MATQPTTRFNMVKAVPENRRSGVLNRRAGKRAAAPIVQRAPLSNAVVGTKVHPPKPSMTSTFQLQQYQQQQQQAGARRVADTRMIGVHRRTSTIQSAQCSNNNGNHTNRNASGTTAKMVYSPRYDSYYDDGSDRVRAEESNARVEGLPSRIIGPVAIQTGSWGHAKGKHVVAGAPPQALGGASDKDRGAAGNTSAAATTTLQSWGRGPW